MRSSLARFPSLNADRPCLSPFVLDEHSLNAKLFSTFSFAQRRSVVSKLVRSRRHSLNARSLNTLLTVTTNMHRKHLQVKLTASVATPGVTANPSLYSSPSTVHQKEYAFSSHVLDFNYAYRSSQMSPSTDNTLACQYFIPASYNDGVSFTAGTDVDLPQYFFAEVCHRCVEYYSVTRAAERTDAQHGRTTNRRNSGHMVRL